MTSPTPIPRAEADDIRDMSPGTWLVSDRWTAGDDPATWLCCPGCGTATVLPHDVGDSGRVTPSVVCPASGCDFHDHVTLEGWGS